jgi:hypothetical protein
MDYSTLFNSGVAIACLTYFMYMTNTTIKSMTIAINNNTQVVEELREDIRRRF